VAVAAAGLLATVGCSGGKSPKATASAEQSPWCAAVMTNLWGGLADWDDPPADEAVAEDLAALAPDQTLADAVRVLFSWQYSSHDAAITRQAEDAARVLAKDAAANCVMSDLSRASLIVADFAGDDPGGPALTPDEVSTPAGQVGPARNYVRAADARPLSDLSAAIQLGSQTVGQWRIDLYQVAVIEAPITSMWVWKDGRPAVRAGEPMRQIVAVATNTGPLIWLSGDLHISLMVDWSEFEVADRAVTTQTEGSGLSYYGFETYLEDDEHNLVGQDESFQVGFEVPAIPGVYHFAFDIISWAEPTDVGSENAVFDIAVTFD
jgi:hypothetical protein